MSSVQNDFKSSYYYQIIKFIWRPFVLTHLGAQRTAFKINITQCSLAKTVKMWSIKRSNRNWPVIVEKRYPDFVGHRGRHNTAIFDLQIT